MKNFKIFVLLLALFSFSNLFSQIRAIGGTPLSVTSSSAFLDATSSSTYDGTTNSAKGIVFPRVNLSTFTSFLGVTGSSSSFRTRYDGFMVYNTATTGVAGVGNTQGTLTPGFWYYDNSTAGVGVGTVNGGTWKPLGGSSATANPAVFAVTTATYTALATDGTLLVNVPTGGATVTLPAASANNGKILTIKKVDDDADVLTFSTAVKYDATNTFTTLNYATTLKIQSDGTNWWLIN